MTYFVDELVTCRHCGALDESEDRTEDDWKCLSCGRCQSDQTEEEIHAEMISLLGIYRLIRRYWI